jgi:hypothetical protein
LVGAAAAEEMNNDLLREKEHRSPDALVRFQTRTVARLRRSKQLVVDIGAGVGKFLYHSRHEFNRLIGVETSRASTEYALREFGVTLYPELPGDLGSTPSVITAWHSLEHIPVEQLDQMLSRLAHASDSDTRLIVCVPNAESFQYRWFGEGYAYYDVPNHQHQFSPRSLDVLLNRHGFYRHAEVFGFVYCAFGYVQGLLNTAMPIRNYAYYRRKRGWTFGLPAWRLRLLDALNLAVLPAAALLGLMLTTCDALAPHRRGVMTVCFRKIGSNS